MVHCVSYRVYGSRTLYAALPLPSLTCRVVPEEKDNAFVGLLDGFIVKDLKPVARSKLKVRGPKLKSKALMVRAAAAALEAKLRK
eukprot:26619-Eustigmatos_ZCMA.PRE.1